MKIKAMRMNAIATDRKERKWLTRLLAAYAVWAVLLAIVGVTALSGSTYLGKACNVKGYPPYFRWDSQWYVQIAKKGYDFSETRNSSIAFWPLYPFTINLAHLGGIPLRFVSLFLNALYSLLATLFIYKLARIDYDGKKSFLIAAFWLAFPDSYFLAAGYPDALFALLVALSLYLGRKRNWLVAGLASGLLALAKPYGFLMAPVLFLEYLWSKGWDPKALLRRPDWLALSLPFVSVTGFSFFSYRKFGRPLAFLEAQKTWGRSYSGNPVSALATEAGNNLFSGHILSGSHAPYLWYLFCFAFFIVSLWLSWKKGVRKTYLFFSLLVMMTALLSGTLTSWGRYMFLAFPVFFGPALYLSGKKRQTLVYFAFSIAGLILLADLFVRCFPVE